ncbi:hypothetical protein LSAT2_000197, partial [Lamellibrachia satsuma]
MLWLNKSPWHPAAINRRPVGKSDKANRRTERYRAARVTRNNGISDVFNGPSTPQTLKAPKSIIPWCTVDKCCAVICIETYRFVGVRK